MRYERSESVQRSGDFQSKQLHPPTTAPSYTLQFLQYGQHKNLKVKVTTTRSKVKSRPHNDITHLHPLTNVPTKYQLLCLTVSETYPGQDFKGQSHYNKVKGQIKVTS